MDYPCHGRPATIKVLQSSPLFLDLDKKFTAGRYHSLYAIKDKLPAELEVLAETEDSIIMAIKHKNLPIYAVQFHPETILTLQNNAGLKMISRMMETAKKYA